MTVSPFNEIDIIRLFRISVTQAGRQCGKGRRESMRPLTASFESMWLPSELLQMTLASLMIRMMTTITSQVLQLVTTEFPIIANMKCAMHQVHNSSLSPHSSSQQNKHHELSCTYCKLKSNSLTLPHLSESLPLCCNQIVGILFVG